MAEQLSAASGEHRHRSANTRGMVSFFMIGRESCTNQEERQGIKIFSHFLRKNEDLLDYNFPIFAALYNLTKVKQCHTFLHLNL